MDYYEILGVSRDASDREVKTAYRKLSKEWHPDRHKGDKKAEEKYKQINRAYECLSDPKKKQAYDQFGSEDGAPFGGGGFEGFEGFEGFRGASGLGDIFETFFGGGREGAFGGRRRRPADGRGRDIEVAMTISLAEAFSGVRKTIRLQKLSSCRGCGGFGTKEGGKTVDCGRCGGSGQVTRTTQSFFGMIQQSVLCDICRGAGRVPEKPCPQCSGEGRVQDAKEETIDIPAGIDDGQSLRVRGRGGAGRLGAAAGDLFVRVRVQPDKRFTRDGADLRTSVTIRVADAVLGTDVHIETFSDGITVKVPVGTQPGQVLRVKGKGMPVLNAGRHGDLYVTVNVEIPKRVSRKEKKMWEELRRE